MLRSIRFISPYGFTDLTYYSNNAMKCFFKFYMNLKEVDISVGSLA